METYEDESMRRFLLGRKLSNGIQNGVNINFSSRFMRTSRFKLFILASKLRSCLTYLESESETCLIFTK